MARRKKHASLTHTAESLGTALGQVAARLDAWKKQRTAIAAEIHQWLDSAKGLLGDLGETAGAAPVGGKNKGGRPKGYKMSEDTKKKLRAAWKRRKAAVKPGKDKVTG